MLDHLVAEGRTQHARLLQGAGGAAQGLGHLGQFVVLVGIAGERRWQLQLFVDAGQASGDQCGEGQVGVEVGTADTALDADTLAALAAQAKAGGAVVVAPHRAGGGEGAGLEALVGVDVGGEEVGDVAGVLELAGHPLAHQLGHAELGLGVEEQRLVALQAPQRVVDMAAGAGQVVVPLGHEGDGLALQQGDLLAGVLDDAVAVGHGQRIGVAHVDLFLARAPFALGVFHGDAGRLQVLADGAQHRLVADGLEDAVVLDVVIGRARLAVVLGVDALVALVEQVELQLGGEHALVAALGEAGDLPLEDAARAVRQVLVVVVLHIAQHQGGALQPGHQAHGGEVGLEHEVAVAALPAGGGVAGHRLHVDVVGQQVVAAVGFLVGAVEEELDLEAFADQAALHVDHAGQDGVDAAGFGQLAQLGKGERGGHP